MNKLCEIRVPHTIERLGKEKRYAFIVNEGRIFDNSPIKDPSMEPGEKDLERVSSFLSAISPVAYKDSWGGEVEVSNKASDPSTYDNWDKPGGPQEHMDPLAMKGAVIITKLIQENLKPTDKLDKEGVEIAEQMRKINPFHAGVAAGLHDLGRELSHIFETTELVGGSLANKIGIRKDIQEVFPDERIMLTPPEKNMNDRIKELPAEAVILRIADEFCKRMCGTNRTFTIDDFSPEFQKKWGERYVNRPLSGLASDSYFRRNIDLHNANAKRSFDALNNWLQGITDLTLTDIGNVINKELAPGLRPLSERVPLTSRDLLDGQSLMREVKVGDEKVEVEAFTHIGGPNKKFNEDACTLITDGKSLQVFVVDGGTQVEQVKSLGELSGGKYVADQVVILSGTLDSKNSAANNLKELNEKMVAEAREKHHDIQYGEESKSAPYGSI